MSGVDRELVADALAAITAADPIEVELELTGLVERCGPTRIGADRIVALVRHFTDALPDVHPVPSVGDDEPRVADALEQALLDADAGAGAGVDAGAAASGGSCFLGPTLLALATHLTGRTPHYRPDALGASSTTAAAAAEVLGWALSDDAAERLVAALTAPDRALVEPMLTDPDVLVRTAAATNRCRGDDARPPLATPAQEDTVNARPVGGIAALSMLQREFTQARLAVPQIAVRFARAKRLRHHGPWHHASEPQPSPFDDYRFDGSARLLLGPVREQLAISHAGHGINSYSLNLRLAVGPVAVMAQVGWGGVYSPEDADEEWATLADGVDLLTHGIALADRVVLERRRWLVVHSPFRLGPLPTLLRRDGDRWVVPEEMEELGDGTDEPRGPRDLDAVADRWVLIHNLVEQDLHVHERLWTAADAGVTIPDPLRPDSHDRLVAVVDADRRVVRLEFDADDFMLERRGGVWEHQDEHAVDWLTEVGRLVLRRRVAVGPEAIARFDAAELVGLRLPIEVLVGEE
jgi:YD repeat-containing protein